jgi:tRNA-dihydrouridine synthase 2
MQQLSSSTTPLSFAGKVMLAPMVRVGILPFRLLALEYGADIVYTEEIIDKKLIRSEAFWDEKRSVLQFLSTQKNHMPDPAEADCPSEATSSGRVVVYETCPADRPCILQLGTSDPDLALEAAMKVIDHVDGIDINMCCPKHFSVHGGMGAAMLKTPDVACQIIQKLSEKLKPLGKTVTCKVLLKDTVEETVEFIKRLENAGLSAVAIQAKFPQSRARHKHRWDMLGAVAKQCSVPVIASGDLFDWDAVERIRREIPEISSVMLARGALYNFSVFRKNKNGPDAALDPPLMVARRLVQIGAQNGVSLGYMKYIYNKMFERDHASETLKVVMQMKSHQEIESYFSSKLGSSFLLNENMKDSAICCMELRTDADEVGEEAESKKRRLA